MAEQLINVTGAATTPASPATGAATTPVAPTGATADPATDATATTPVADNPRILELDGERFEVPENLWDAEKNEVRTAAAVKAVGDLRRQIAEREEMAKGTMGAPENYTFTMPDALKDKVEIPDDDPLLASAMAWAKEAGVTQEQFSQLTDMFLEQQAAALDVEMSGKAEQETALNERLGAGAEKIRKDLEAWVGGLLGAEFDTHPGMLDAVQGLVQTADGVMVLKTFYDVMKEAGLPSGNTPGAAPAAAVSQDELRALQASPAYNNSHHPDHVAVQARVLDGYKRLFPGNQIG